ncbi:MAG: B12-binding domain-containing radical SAM protein [Proteobacteria bacterium]|nr:B12-binding domain-containing radical SAM protein [Pseudomonadota bacterium]MBU4296681.1 B12-binding domain-containing radical SAM protein [Pseudomonadota bacterium]MCG2748474.1 B12-binding domain-containing radical SAM protein [Desulfobulbaceae bacterium]
MNILFLNPPFLGRFSRSSRSPAVTKGGTLYYPIWLSYAAGVAEQAGYAVRLLDAPAQGLGVDEVFQKLFPFSPDLIVIDTSTPSIFHDVKVATEFKGRFPHSFIVLVGTHPSALPEETLQISAAVDGVAVGEYDFIIRDLAAALASGKDMATVAGLVWRDNGQVVVNAGREKIIDLDSLPFVTSVYKKHLDVRDYFFAAASYPMVMIMSGRGCPHRCFFCVYPQVMHGRRYRVRSAENVVEEMAYVAHYLPEVREVGFEDDCFTANIRRVHDICEQIIARNIRMKWYCNVRGNLEYPTLALMKQAGCRLVTVGFESGCQQVLDGMHKDEKVEHYHAFGRAARRAGMLVHGCLMVGNPGDTAETLAASYEFAKRIDCDSMQFYPLYVYPGTEAYDWAVKNNYLSTTDFAEWLTPDGLHNCVLNTPELSAAEMVGLCDTYLKKYHLRPSYIARKAWQGLCNPSEGLRTVKSARVFLSKLLAGQLSKTTRK